MGIRTTANDGQKKKTEKQQNTRITISEPCLYQFIQKAKFHFIRIQLFIKK